MGRHADPGEAVADQLVVGERPIRSGVGEPGHVEPLDEDRPVELLRVDRPADDDPGRVGRGRARLRAPLAVGRQRARRRVARRLPRHEELALLVADLAQVEVRGVHPLGRRPARDRTGHRRRAHRRTRLRRSSPTVVPPPPAGRDVVESTPSPWRCSSSPPPTARHRSRSSRCASPPPPPCRTLRVSSSGGSYGRPVGCQCLPLMARCATGGGPGRFRIASCPRCIGPCREPGPGRRARTRARSRWRSRESAPAPARRPAAARQPRARRAR